MRFWGCATLEGMGDEWVALVDDEEGALPPAALAEALRQAHHEEVGATRAALAVTRMALNVEAARAVLRAHSP